MMYECCRSGVSFRQVASVKTILLAAGIALLLSLFGTPVAIRIFRRHGYGQLIRDDGPQAHKTKRGTPTMGGTVIVIASVLGYFPATCSLTTRRHHLACWCWA